MGEVGHDRWEDGSQLTSGRWALRKDTAALRPGCFFLLRCGRRLEEARIQPQKNSARENSRTLAPADDTPQPRQQLRRSIVVQRGGERDSNVNACSAAPRDE